MKPRNPYAVFAKFRKAGFHKKTNKALRKAMKQNPDYLLEQRR